MASEGIAGLTSELCAAMVAAGCDPWRVKAVTQLIDGLHARGAGNLEPYVRKLIRTAPQPEEFNGIAREGVVARDTHDGGSHIGFEPLGRKGPDFAFCADGQTAYGEVKRLIQTDKPDADAVEDWHTNEFGPGTTTAGSRKPTRKVRGTIKQASHQLAGCEPSVIFLIDFSDATQTHFRQVVRSGRKQSPSAAVYWSNWSSGTAAYNIRKPRYFMWLNEHAAVPLPDALQEVMSRAFRPDIVRDRRQASGQRSLYP